MSFLDALLGRSKPQPANLDALFALPSAAVTLEASTGLKPSGRAGVCFKPAGGETFAEAGEELRQLLQLEAKDPGTEVSWQDDSYGYRWVVLALPDLSGLVTAAHLVNTTLQDHGFGSQLLCSVFGFAPGEPATDTTERANPQVAGNCFLVYLYKRGTFYPFAPLGGEKRDNELELALRGVLMNELPIETDLTRWFPLWGLPLPSPIDREE